MIDKLAKGAIDADTFRKQSQSLLQQSKPTLSINEQQIQRSFENVVNIREGYPDFPESLK
ncbi:hypothetical protein [Staphylococcus aureus]|uniref:hypothetical protein n=1 Tax=Staphylococcus aureus TaxID=1280 RepID=UPI00210D98F2|nr:hypothetical protein [Staphylococcus aureus]